MWKEARGLSADREAWLFSDRAFITLSIRVQPARKWLKTTREQWRVRSLGNIVDLNVAEDHNGFSHQDPGFIDHVANKKAEVVRIYLPPDANTLLAVADRCLKSRNFVNVIVAGKQPEWQWLDIEAAVAHCEAGIGIWPWAGNDAGDPDVVMGCAGDVPTLETLAAVTLLRKYVPDIRVRVVNVVDLMALQPGSEHPHGWEDARFDAVSSATSRSFRVPRLSGHHSPLTPARQSRESARARLQERGRPHAVRNGCSTTTLSRFDSIRRIPRQRAGAQAAER